MSGNGSISVVFLCNAPAVPAGVEKTVRTLVRQLPEHAVRPRVILNGGGPFFEQLRGDGVDVEQIPAGRRPNPAALLALRNSLRARPASVLQLHLSRFFAPFLPRNLHLVERLNMTRHRARWYPMRWRWLDRTTARWINAFVVVSDNLRETFLERGYPAQRLHVVHNGVEIPPQAVESTLRGELGIPADAPLVGAMGRLTEQKGLDLFLQAAGAIAQKLPSAHFAIAGSGEQRVALERQASQLGLSERAHFLGHRADSSRVLSGFDLLLYPSRWEPFANTILEAMAVGTPVVASHVGGNAEAIRQEIDGFLVPPDNPSALAAAALRLLADASLRRRLAESARERARDFSIDSMVRGHAELYRDLVAAPAR